MSDASSCDLEDSEPGQGPAELPSFARRALVVLWPAFLMAGVQEMLVFVVVDPATLTCFGVDRLDWPASAVYTVTFLILWITTATAGAITQLLQSPGGAPHPWGGFGPPPAESD
jgi:hypothetical protein